MPCTWHGQGCSQADGDWAVLAVQGGRQQVGEWVELANGCLCCSVKDNFLVALEGLVGRRDQFDHVLVETTGALDGTCVAHAGPDWRCRCVELPCGMDRVSRLESSSTDERWACVRGMLGGWNVC
jgi:hypothetical protein